MSEKSAQFVFYNALTRSKDLFTPMDPKHITIYVCGPTVYARAHIGNARPAVVFDVLVRLLRYIYGNEHVVYTRNITDIDDKIIKVAQERKLDFTEITHQYTQLYHQDIAKLNVLKPDIEPNATGYIISMIEMIKVLIEKKYAYVNEGHVLFHVSRFAEYGFLSGRCQEDQIAGARVEIAPYKKDPADFILWKPAKENEPFWDSPWGKGRPGWHLECSAMIEKNLGLTIDIHGGGHDLKFPHHENEIAQSRCAHDGKALANYWLHNGFLQINSEKMAKSSGNVLYIHDLLKKMPGEVIRYALLSTQYRQSLEWTDQLLETSLRSLNRLYRKLERLEGIEPIMTVDSNLVIEALKDDLNTPKAMTELHALISLIDKVDSHFEKAKLKGKILKANTILGILDKPFRAWFEKTNSDQNKHESDQNQQEIKWIETRIESRQLARKQKDFKKADQIRDELLNKGIILEDLEHKTVWRKQ